ncbi:MAG TPA: NTP transferase domain-containing protein [Methanothrix sp.]|jgi:adenosylcobinamide-phosphate guanylyltransferase|uniref:NTP transferase domain-containing protein n=1 Tax=Methanothrix sp. TaxID=90426 RepID=UPI002C7B7535|nr:NTP transferase domain-containing protein [Methanothrix sp.]MDI9416295.1 NTP transferase domain-containing protein [Euryarchaeota archaeon]HON36473.1 NTP transferase domain-containing protein [Methanothrix sp.]HRU75954.1 NTP transferase domain-containing protein [Methanothrix sp.]
MAGGRGSRLKRGEKPMVTIFGRRLIEYVALALEESSVERIHIATTENVPLTREWALDWNLSVLDTPGMGFVPDMIYAVKAAEVADPIMIVMADLPLINSDLIDTIIEVYEGRPEPALSTHTPLDLHRRLGRRPDSLFNYRDQLIVPSGINVLEGREIEREQEDYHLIMERIELAVNVNVAEDLRLCERILQGDFI